MNENNYHYQLKVGESMLSIFIIGTIGIYSFLMYYILQNVNKPKKRKVEQLSGHFQQ
ncbi:hypothetical protein [Fredinandcohnia sp. 179-A 10B2 NHS]|uniref:hypothetical protein n=1 Tax=Fredinandcohnia sp. 179-A 10B2 NHS TaxID=3235176 RepID=UPI0039A2912E